MGDLIKTLKPNFSKENVEIYKGMNTNSVRYIKYTDKLTGEFFAKYLPEYKELQLQEDLFHSLNGYFGDDMIVVLNWFNNEFNQDAEMVLF